MNGVRLYACWLIASVSGMAAADLQRDGYTLPMLLLLMFSFGAFALLFPRPQGGAE